MKHCFAGLLAMCFVATASAQTVGSQAFFKKLEALSDSISAASPPDNIDFERLELANARLRTWLLAEGAKNPEWLGQGTCISSAAVWLC